MPTPSLLSIGRNIGPFGSLAKSAWISGAEIEPLTGP